MPFSCVFWGLRNFYQVIGHSISTEDCWQFQHFYMVLKQLLYLFLGGMSNRENDVSEVKNYQETPKSGNGSPQISSGNFNLQIDSQKLEEEIDQVLRALRKAHQTEYRIAEERLLAQKNCLLNLYRQLDKERSELSMHTSSDDNALLEAVLKRVDQIKREMVKLRDMEVVAKGFGKTSKDILELQFGIETE